MDFAARHIGYVIAAYGVALVLLAGLVGVIVLRMRAVRKRLAELEAQGARRRAPARASSAENSSAKPAAATFVEGRKPS